MGIECIRGIAAFATNLLWEGENQGCLELIGEDDVQVRGDTDCPRILQLEALYQEYDDETPGMDAKGFLTVNGWKWNPNRCEKVFKRFYLSPLTKGNHKVYILNESQYESVGDWELRFVAKDRESLAAFLKDCFLDGDQTIHENLAIVWFT